MYASHLPGYEKHSPKNLEKQSPKEVAPAPGFEARILRDRPIFRQADEPMPITKKKEMKKA